MNNILPRAGELVRPYTIGKLEDIPKSAAFGTIVVERLIDTLSFVILVVVHPLAVPRAAEGILPVAGEHGDHRDDRDGRCAGRADRADDAPELDRCTPGRRAEDGVAGTGRPDREGRAFVPRWVHLPQASGPVPHHLRPERPDLGPLCGHDVCRVLRVRSAVPRVPERDRRSCHLEHRCGDAHARRDRNVSRPDIADAEPAVCGRMPRRH